MTLVLKFQTLYKCCLDNLKNEAISISMKSPQKIVKQEKDQIILQQLTDIDKVLQNLLKLPKQIIYVENISIQPKTFSIQTEINVKKFTLNVLLNYSECNITKKKKFYKSICNATISLKNVNKSLHPLASTFISSEYNKCRRTEKTNLKLKNMYY